MSLIPFAPFFAALRMTAMRCLQRLECISDTAKRNRFNVRDRGFTLIEILVVIAIILVLAGLILSTAGYVQKKAARSRAETEIAAMSAALESYKADNGIYPTDHDRTENVNPDDPPPATASQFLYEQLSGDANDDRTAEGKSYFTFKPNMLSPLDQSEMVQYIRDPFGNPYGYSTARATGQIYGYNPTFDLWSKANADPATDQRQWIKNW